MSERISLSNAVRKSRFIKELAAEEGINVRGIGGQAFDSFFETRVLPGVDFLKHNQTAFMTRREKMLSPLLGNVSRDEAEESFVNGLRNRYLQLFRVCKRLNVLDSSDNPLTGNAAYQIGIISSFAFDYLRSLRTALRIGVEPGMALQIASLSYRYNPDLLPNLRGQFPEFGITPLTYAATDYKDPAGFLNQVSEKIAQIEEQFPDFPISTIRHAVIYHKNPEAFLRRVEGMIPDLVGAFPDFPQSLIKTSAVIFSKDPVAVLRDARQTLKDLTVKYGHTRDYLLKFASVVYSKDPEGYLNQMQAVIDKLKNSYPEFSEAEVLQASVQHPADPEGMLRAVRDLTPQFKQCYPEMPAGLIKEIVLRTRKAEATLQQIDSKTQDLKTKFPAMAVGVLYLAASRKNPERYIDEYAAKYLSKN